MKHKLIKTEDGQVDFWVMDYGHHNGPGCSRCHESWCHHCEHPDEPWNDEECPGDQYQEKGQQALFWEEE